MYALYTGGNPQMNSLTLRDCEIYGSGSCWFGDISMNTPVFTFQNNLFWETGINASYDADKITLYNNLFYGTANESVTESDWGSGSVTNHDNVFDGLNAVSLDGANGHNAFVGMNANNLSPTPGSSDIVLPGFNWQAGPLGNFYQATNSPFINRGSRSAAAAGLYHYTVLTNQSIEDGATNVALGYHYIAVDGNGNPLDANGDGIPDYLEDANGNGLVDNNEMDWMTHYPTLIGPAIQVYTPLKLQ
jgi:hypothetical protein